MNGVEGRRGVRYDVFEMIYDVMILGYEGFYFLGYDRIGNFYEYGRFWLRQLGRLLPLDREGKGKETDVGTWLGNGKGKMASFGNTMSRSDAADASFQFTYFMLFTLRILAFVTGLDNEEVLILLPF